MSLNEIVCFTQILTNCALFEKLGRGKKNCLQFGEYNYHSAELDKEDSIFKN